MDELDREILEAELNDEHDEDDEEILARENDLNGLIDAELDNLDELGEI